MNKIALKGMKFFAHHGFYEEETKMGAYFLLDVSVAVDFTKAGENDQLEDTVNYENIYEICTEVMSTPAKLLEHVVSKIEVKLTKSYPSILGVDIVLQKLNPPLGGSVQASQVSISKQYGKKCSRCNRSFLCHNNASCWCNEYSISESVTAGLKKDYKDCLCAACLSELG